MNPPANRMRFDLEIIASWIEPGSRVIDLGCGEGDLLLHLITRKGVIGRGIERNEEKVAHCIERGLSVLQGDINEEVLDYPEGGFDYVILSQTLQEVRRPLHVMNEMLRVGRRAIVAFPNFGHWRVRLAHLFTGRAPKTTRFPHEWYDSPNIHFFTVDDFEILAARENWNIEKRVFLDDNREVKMLPNLLAETAVYLVRLKS